jgi:hypothetical protein
MRCSNVINSLKTLNPLKRSENPARESAGIGMLTGQANDNDISLMRGTRSRFISSWHTMLFFEDLLADAMLCHQFVQLSGADVSFLGGQVYLAFRA